jgi:hypothetical protein
MRDAFRPAPTVCIHFRGGGLGWGCRASSPHCCAVLSRDDLRGQESSSCLSLSRPSLPVLHLPLARPARPFRGSCRPLQTTASGRTLRAPRSALVPVRTPRHAAPRPRCGHQGSTYADELNVIFVLLRRWLARRGPGRRHGSYHLGREAGHACP